MEENVAEHVIVKLRGKHQVQVKALEKELRAIVRLREKSRLQEEDS